MVDTHHALLLGAYRFMMLLKHSFGLVFFFGLALRNPARNMPKIEKMLNVLEENVLPQHLPQLGIVVRAYGTSIALTVQFDAEKPGESYLPSMDKSSPRLFKPLSSISPYSTMALSFGERRDRKQTLRNVYSWLQPQSRYFDDYSNAMPIEQFEKLCGPIQDTQFNADLAKEIVLNPCLNMAEGLLIEYSIILGYKPTDFTLPHGNPGKELDLTLALLQSCQRK
ncbi:hypothetical protein PRIPAC_73762 [Pristionchus pacificus]|uniref:Uncharacterized protein n=1 Tax=Pristionchus pacificus TaxID=54126 RepID=A0A2A6BFJ7_PRIPA|nr:hypothetical protein PRIPAC_88611 [Pristionchus pacificus]KAF8364276.1 hypothetical protein PRIPAC_91199 [Pristionchus pacificus]KAF8372696.1 hypothetical protein PRIPAC_79125 [Pristionchus pacificus]KAF8384620.1 hypothetical protein PRIPAC_73762 [Pristionchus pacificus]|eukprot:PDM62105.1 hypothetical protein PRIPAC_51547 [Pristionchus pacificus]